MSVMALVLASCQCGPGSIPSTQRRMWVEFIGSVLCFKSFYPGTQVFPSTQKLDLICITLLISVYRVSNYYLSSASYYKRLDT